MIKLLEPSINNLYYRIKWLNDKETMAYNKGLDLNIKGYSKEEGTILMTEEESILWYHKWINRTDRYYAYIYALDKIVGEAYYYLEDQKYVVGILIQNKYRGMGYGYLALKELISVAHDNGINCLYDYIPEDRVDVIKLFKRVGFTETNEVIKEKYFDKERIVKELIYKKR